jgi:hypothetical protein
LAWFATADDRLIGALIRDRVDNDYGWVLLARNDTGIYRCIDMAASLARLLQEGFSYVEMNRYGTDIEIKGPTKGPGKNRWPEKGRCQLTHRAQLYFERSNSLSFSRLNDLSGAFVDRYARARRRQRRYSPWAA